jgi:2-polyprenyl-3-methyl-5-hydroxy-6-metoxy-1,4-benzoquinol methylase
MKPSKQAKNYDKLAKFWASSEFNQENGIKQHKRALQFVENKGYAIDVGCGSSGRIIDLLLKNKFIVEGLDYSPEMLKYAKRKHPQVKFHYTDICQWDFQKKYDFISAWDSVWHAPLNNQADILRKLCQALTNKGVLIYTSGAVDEAGEVSNKCQGQMLYHAAIGIPAILKIIDKCQCVCRHLENDDWPSNHLYVIIQRIK